jgi:hypothetical protein
MSTRHDDYHDSCREKVDENAANLVDRPRARHVVVVVVVVSIDIQLVFLVWRCRGFFSRPEKCHPTKNATMKKQWWLLLLLLLPLLLLHHHLHGWCL